MASRSVGLLPGVRCLRTSFSYCIKLVGPRRPLSDLHRSPCGISARTLNTAARLHRKRGSDFSRATGFTGHNVCRPNADCIAQFARSFSAFSGNSFLAPESSESPSSRCHPLQLPGSMLSFSTSAIAFKAVAPEDTVIMPQNFVVPDAPSAADPDMILAHVPTSDLAELGLGSWLWPTGWVQNFLDFAHGTIGLPWWGSIMIATVMVRLCMFPLVIKAQRNAAIMSKSMPEMQRIQLKMSEARLRGDLMEAAQASHELNVFMKSGGFNPFKTMLPALAQAPVFMSCFFGLRAMANAPVESMKEGGIFWFTDLTIPDPYYLLPVMTSATLLAVIELGVDGMSTEHMHLMKYVFRAMPLVMLLFITKFPAALLCYWFSSNAFSLAQALFLKIPAVRIYFKIPEKVKYAPDSLPMKKKTVRETFRDAMQNGRISKEINDRARIDSINFRQAGMGAVKKTYKYDPTKPRPVQIAAKKAD